MLEAVGSDLNHVIHGGVCIGPIATELCVSADVAMGHVATSRDSVLSKTPPTEAILPYCTWFIIFG